MVQREAAPKPYRILCILGQGGMGVVYKAQNMESNEIVALKTVRVANINHVQNIRREIRGLAQLNHRGIVKILDEGLWNDMPWYAMEYLEGLTLDQFSACSEIFSSSLNPKSDSGKSREVSRELRSSDAETGPTIRIRTDKVSSGPELVQSWWTTSLSEAGKSELKRGVPQGGEALSLREMYEKILSACQKSFSANKSDYDNGPLQMMSIYILLVKRIAQTLAALHGEGFVHRDLKPDNILIRDDGMPVLVDFGLITQFYDKVSREKLELENSVMGSLHYMAPEQIQGHLVDARADLYALGSIFYQLLTGQLHVHGSSKIDLIKSHLYDQPAQPSALCPHIPEDISNVIVTLLSKDPKNRYGYASDVAAVLDKHCPDGETPLLPHVKSYLYRPGLSGRDSELSFFIKKLELLTENKGGLFFIGGESGIGKTRFLLELGRQAIHHDVFVLSSESGSAHKDSISKSVKNFEPFQLLRKPLRTIGDYCRQRGRKTTDHIIGAHGKILATIEPDLIKLPGQDEYRVLDELAPDANQQRLFRSLAETLHNFAQCQPVMMLLDDLQWSDDFSRGFLRYLLKKGYFKNSSLLIVGSYRTDEIDDSLQSLFDMSPEKKTILKLLKEDAVRAIVRDMLALDDAPAQFISFMSKHSEGNPFFVAEYLRAAVESQLFWRDESCRWNLAPSAVITTAGADYNNIPLPHSLDSLIRHRLSHLSDDARCVLEAASILGREMHYSILCKVTSLAQNRTMDGLLQLMNRQIMEQGEADTYKFIHDSFRESGAANLDIEKRKHLHKIAAKTIESDFQDRLVEFSAQLGFHWMNVGNHKKAREYYLIAAKNAMSQYALKDAEELYKSYLSLVDEVTLESVKVRAVLGERVLRIRAKTDEALKMQQQAAHEAKMLGHMQLETDLFSSIGTIKWQIGEVDEALKIYEQAHTFTKQSGNKKQEIVITANLAVLHAEQGRLEKAGRLLENALLLSRELGEEKREASILGNLGFVSDQAGEISRSRHYYEQALTISQRKKDRRHQTFLLNNLALQYHEQGLLKEAKKLFDEALKISREIFDMLQEAQILSNIAALREQQGLFAEAQTLYKQALSIVSDTQNTRIEAYTLCHFGAMLTNRAHFVRAGTKLDRALTLSRKIGDLTLEARILIYQARLLRLAEGDSKRAENLVLNSEKIVRKVGNIHILVLCLTEKGMINIAVKRSAHREIQEIESLLKKLETCPESKLYMNFIGLRTAEKAFQAGKETGEESNV